MKRKMIASALTMIITTSLLTGCGLNPTVWFGDNSETEESENNMEENELNADTDTNGVPSGKKSDNASIEMEYVDLGEYERENEGTMLGSRQDENKGNEIEFPKMRLLKEVEKDGRMYLEVNYTESSSSVDYSFEGYGITVVSNWEEVGDELYVDGDKESFSFDIVQSENGKIEGKLIGGDYATHSQFGDTEIQDFSNLFKYVDEDNFRSTVSFGKAYYDYENTLYIDVMITVPHKFYTDTVVLNLDEL